MSNKKEKQQKQPEKQDWKDELKKVKVKQNPSANPAAGSTSAISVSGVYEHITGIPNPATAPYNFVPLNEQVVPTECEPAKDFAFDKYHEGRYTGYIDLTIETKTPLYIRGTLTEDEIKQEIDSKNKPDFFSPTGKFCIPGSSLRGMIRTMVEIMSYGKFEFFDNKRLYFRGMADLALSLRNYYNKRILNAKAGILYKKGLSYFIKETSFSKISKSEAKTKVTELGKSYSEFEFYEVGTYYLIVSGKMQGKENDWLVQKSNSTVNEIELAKEDVDNYVNDTTRKKEAPNLIKKLAKNSEVPCFYVTWKDKNNHDRVSFGHTKMFRMAYETSIADHVGEAITNNSIIDIPEAIFGNKETFAGRVFFEDAFLKNPSGNDCEEEKVVTLLGPKPTTFQHYLVQTKENMKSHPCNLAHYDSNPLTAIRGHKLYWHKENQKYKNSSFNSNTDTKIKPVKTDKTFTGRIRFENLSAVELGALLSALELPPDCCHKIGMGKPLGLGSVEITPKLYLSNRKERYESLNAEWGEVSESTQNGEEIKDFKDAFEKYVLDKLGENGKKFWEIDRMEELEKMLKFNPKPPDNKTEYMSLGSFRERKVLPKPTEVR